MIYYRNLKNISPDLDPTVVTIGNFDGVHVGHQQLLNKLLQQSKSQQLPSLLVSFDPYPKEFFLGDSIPRLMSWREKYISLKESGVDYFVTIQFNKAFAALTAEAFVKQILVDKLHAKVVIIGDDFHFGTGRKGDYELLCSLGKKHDFNVIRVPTCKYTNERVSSSRIRHVLQAGNMALACELLGHHYYLCGTVVHGDKRGRKLGFPTANIDLHRRLVPLVGVYVVQVSIAGKMYQGAANIGTRPAVNGTRVLLEVYIFDFEQQIYGQNIKVEFLHKLRDEENYESLDLLKEQIQKDVDTARAYFSY